MIRVLLVDDHRLIRASLRLVLEKADDLEVVAEAASGEAAVACVRKDPPDIVLMDINMPGIGGLEATRKIHALAPEVCVIALSAYTDDPFPARLVEAGARGYLTKDATPDEVLEAVRRVHRGEIWLDAGVAQRLARRAMEGQSDASPLKDLTARELQVMVMLTQGLKPGEIAETVKLSVKTISTYKYRVFAKLGVRNDVELAQLAMRHGIEVGLK